MKHITFLWSMIFFIVNAQFAVSQTYENEPNGSPLQTGVITISSIGNIQGDVCLGAGCPSADPTDFWSIANGSSGTLIATWSDNVLITLRAYTTSERNTVPVNTELSSGNAVVLSQDAYYSLSVQFIALSTFTEYTVSLSGTALNTLGTSEEQLNNTVLEIFPNPSKNTITIKGLTDQENFSIYNVLGQLVSSGRVNDNERINIEPLNDGVYFLKLAHRQVLRFYKR